MKKLNGYKREINVIKEIYIIKYFILFINSINFQYNKEYIDELN